MTAKRAISRVLSASVAMLMATAALAQDSEPPKPTTLSETYDTWTVQCATAPAAEGQPAKRQCQMSQELLQQESRQRMMLFAVTKDSENARAMLILPFGLLLSEGVRIEITGKELMRGQFRTCLPAGCIVEADLPAESLAQLQAAETASVFMTAVTGQPVKTDLSLKGFAAAYKRLLALAEG